MLQVDFAIPMRAVPVPCNLRCGCRVLNLLCLIWFSLSLLEPQCASACASGSAAGSLLPPTRSADSGAGARRGPALAPSSALATPLLERDSTGRFFFFFYHIYLGTKHLVFRFHIGWTIGPRYTTHGHERCDSIGGSGNTRQSVKVRPEKVDKFGQQFCGAMYWKSPQPGGAHHIRHRMRESGDMSAGNRRLPHQRRAATEGNPELRVRRERADERAPPRSETSEQAPPKARMRMEAGAAQGSRMDSRIGKGRQFQGRRNGGSEKTRTNLGEDLTRATRRETPASSSPTQRGR